MSCALWIPEVKIGNIEKMEPITNIEGIPVSDSNNNILLPPSLPPSLSLPFSLSSNLIANTHRVDALVMRQLKID